MSSPQQIISSNNQSKENNKTNEERNKNIKLSFTEENDDSPRKPKKKCC